MLLPIVTCLAFLASAWWFIGQRENKPRIDFKAEIEWHKKIGDYWVVELVAHIENRGKVQHKFQNLDFDLYYLAKSDKIELSKSINNQVFFPHTLVKGGSFINKELYLEFWTEPGVKDKYSYVTRVPVEAEVVIFHVWFDYQKSTFEQWFDKVLRRRRPYATHVAEATKALPEEGR